MEKTKHQSFEVATMKRSEINLAKYNPRIIDNKNREKLKQALCDNGLVETLLVNRRTNTLVSGHQRISILDSLEKNHDYLLDVAIIDVDEKTEAKINVQLNQRSLQGDFDFNALMQMMDEFDFEDFELGFEEFEVLMKQGEENLKHRGNDRRERTKSNEVKTSEGSFRKNGQSLENHFKVHFPSVNPYDMPDIFPQFYDLEGIKWVSFNERHGITDYENTVIHCYNEDYQINILWTQPDKHLELFRKCRAVVTPDFSMYTDMPKALLVYNAYRRQWVGRYWQENGISVIPSCSYPEGMIEDYTFAGIPKQSIIAASNAYSGLDEDAEIEDMKKIFEMLEPKLLFVKASDFKADRLKKYFDFERIPTYVFSGCKKH